MSRSFRMYGKKRGDRRTGSPTLGSAGEALFFGFFFVIGCGGIISLLANVIVPEWRANHDFVETSATVLQAKASSNPADESQFRPEIAVSYRAGEQDLESLGYDIVWAYTNDRESNQSRAAAFQVGQAYPAWYDPRHPENIVLVRGYSGWLWLLVLVPLAFIAIGGGGLGYTIRHWGKSVEAKAVASRRAAEMIPFDRTPHGPNFPSIPSDANITNSPGMRLKYRLPINILHGWRLLAIAVACVFWNSIVGVFAVPILQGGLQNVTQWIMLLLLLPFVAVGIGLIYYFVRQFLIATGIGVTLLEVSDHPLIAGQNYEVLISQAGHLIMTSIRVELICEEEASYRQGTDTRTDRRRVFQQAVFHREGVEIQPGLPYEARWQLAIPPQAMHSFKSEHNEVQWRLVVKGVVEGWPDFERSFPVIVYPQPNAVETTSRQELLTFEPNAANGTGAGNQPAAQK